MRVWIIAGLMAVGIFLGNGQVHAMNLLLAAGNPQMQISVEDGRLQLTSRGKDEGLPAVSGLEVKDIEPASGE